MSTMDTYFHDYADTVQPAVLPKPLKDRLRASTPEPSRVMAVKSCNTFTVPQVRGQKRVRKRTTENKEKMWFVCQGPEGLDDMVARTTITVRRSGSTFLVLDLMQPLQQVTPGFVMHVFSHSCPKTYIVCYIYIYCIDTYLFIEWKEIRNVYLLLLLLRKK